MDQENEKNSYSLLATSSSSFLEIRLFYVRITSCLVDAVPDHLLLRHLHSETTASPLQINGTHIPSSDTATVTLRRDHLNKESSEVTYVSTDNVRVTGAVEFEVLEEASNELILCGSLERLETALSGLASESDVRTGWSMECYVGANVTEGNPVFLRPGIEVYVAGCCGGVPVILTKNIAAVSPRRKEGSRHGIVLDAIPEDEEVMEKEHNSRSNGFVSYRKLQISDPESDEYDLDLDGNLGNRYYSKDMYYGEDGQLSWFNAGVRVGVGIGLGMCIGVGIGVGLLMQSYQATTRNFRRRFF